MAKELRLNVLPDLCWSFVAQPESDSEMFQSRVRNYQIRIRKKDSWQPEEIAISSPTVVIRYRVWDGDMPIEPELNLVAHNGRFFPAGELLQNIHNAIVEQVREQDHHFWEGLTLVGFTADQRPVYQLRLGS